MALIRDLVSLAMRSVLTAPGRSLVTIAAVCVVLAPYLVGVSIEQGIRDQIDVSLDRGADLYVGGTRFGRFSALDQRVVEELKSIPGVESVIPRVVGHLHLGKVGESAILVGLPRSEFPKSVECVDGSLEVAAGGHQLVFGTQLARQLNLSVGDVIPPLYRSQAGEKTATVVGLFKADAAIWQARLVFTDLVTASEMFDAPDRVTEVLLYCRPGYVPAVRRAAHRMLADWETESGVTVHTTSRNQVRAFLDSEVNAHSARFSMNWVLAIVVGISVTFVVSGMGEHGRSREVAVLKLLGWRTEQVLVRSLIEGLVLVAIATSISIMVCFVWLQWGNGAFIAQYYISGAAVRPAFRVPFRMMPVPVLVGLGTALAMVLVGAMYSTWRAANASPGTRLR